MDRSRSYAVKVLKDHPVVTSFLVCLVASAILNRTLAKKAERRNPPTGRFVTIDGVRLHYVERGTGHQLVLLHGNGSMIQDFESSGLIDLAAMKYRVIAFDRPGFGHSDRPRRMVWTPEAQAALLNAALTKMGVSQPLVFGHSWGTLVAVALALNYPRNVRASILASGYYYPTVRADVLVLSPPALPFVGDILSHTISPILGRLLWPICFARFSARTLSQRNLQAFRKRWRCVHLRSGPPRPKQRLMIPAAYSFREAYRYLKMPVVIVAGREDQVSEAQQSAELHRDIAHSTFRCISDKGHMVHQTATAEVMSAIDLANQTKEVPNADIGGERYLKEAAPAAC